MKKILLTISVLTMLGFAASAQVLPSFQFGLKAGANLSTLSSTNTFSSSAQAGYLGGIWARFGALGFNFQPELYVTGKDVKVENGTGTAKFTSVDMPLLFGGKFGAMGVGGRLYTGPVASFAVDHNQSFFTATKDAVTFDRKDTNVAWQFGAGLDIQAISIDLRYEAGITKRDYTLSNGNTGSTRINLFNVTLAYRLFSL